MIIITAEWHAKPGKESDLATALKTMVAAVKKNEPNCMQYTLHQGLENKQLWYFYERYTDMKAIEAHKATPHFQQLIESTKDCIAAPVVVNLYTVAE